jgi:hypothetical protein
MRTPLRFPNRSLNRLHPLLPHRLLKSAAMALLSQILAHQSHRSQRGRALIKLSARWLARCLRTSPKPRRKRLMTSDLSNVSCRGKSDLDDEAEDWERLRNPTAEKEVCVPLTRAEKVLMLVLGEARSRGLDAHTTTRAQSSRCVLSIRFSFFLTLLQLSRDRESSITKVAVASSE